MRNSLDNLRESEDYRFMTEEEWLFQEKVKKLKQDTEDNIFSTWLDEIA